jgi:hypothetical protein
MNDANDSPDTADTADKSDRWTVRGIGAATRRKAADMAAKADIPLGRWLSRLIEHAADKSDMADVPADVYGAVLARLERLERAVFVADMADVADMKSAVAIAPVVADMSDALAAVAPCQIAGVMADTADTADINSTEPPCPTRSPESDTRTPLEAAGVPAGAVGAAGAGTGAADSTDVPGATGALRKRLSGDAKAERAAEITRRLAAGESKPDIMSAMGISLATLNRDIA